MSTKRVVYYFDEKGENPAWDFITLLPANERNKCFEYIEYLERKHHFRLNEARLKLAKFMNDLLAKGNLYEWDIPKANNLKRLAEREILK